jgi:hypothetical protein
MAFQKSAQDLEKNVRQLIDAKQNENHSFALSHSFASIVETIRGIFTVRFEEF